MVAVAASRIWRDVEVYVGGERMRAMNLGRLNFDYESKTFADGANTRATCSVRRSGSTMSASATETPSETGCRLQSYWRFQYELDIGGLTDIGADARAGSALNTTVSGLYNIIQTFDIAPGRGRSPEFEVNFRNVRGDSRGGGSRIARFNLNHSQNVTMSRDRASIMTSTAVSIAITFSASLPPTVANKVARALRSDVPEASGSGASVDLSIRSTLDLILTAETVVELPSGR